MVLTELKEFHIDREVAYIEDRQNAMQLICRCTMFNVELLKLTLVHHAFIL